jgi:signal transduction histidine kinase
MRVTRIFLTQMSPSVHLRALAAACEAFPEAEVIEANTVEEAGQKKASGQLELLVLAEPDAATAARAVKAVDFSGLPRWAVVILGRDLSGVAETVPAEEWNTPLLARVFRSALQQHELLRENLRLQGDLKTVARRISHDLYTPVGCIYTSSHVLKMILSGDNTPEIADMVRNMEDSSKEISQLIDRVSFMLRASADPCSPEHVEMAGVVAGVVRQLEPEIQETGASVAQPASWPEVSGVPQWLHVIWWNLLNNALKHGGPGAQVRMAWNPEGDGYRFWVADRGAGVAPAILDGLFRPFDQLHLLPAPGLGLSIVQRLVALQGGRCGYERLNKGSSVFYFTLPAKAHGHHQHETSPRVEAFRPLSPKPAHGFPSAEDDPEITTEPSSSLDAAIAAAFPSQQARDGRNTRISNN